VRSVEVANTNYIVFGFNGPMFEPTSYHILGEYTTDGNLGT